MYKHHNLMEQSADLKHDLRHIAIENQTSSKSFKPLKFGNTSNGTNSQRMNNLFTPSLKPPVCKIKKNDQFVRLMD